MTVITAAAMISSNAMPRGTEHQAAALRRERVEHNTQPICSSTTTPAWSDGQSLLAGSRSLSSSPVTSARLATIGIEGCGLGQHQVNATVEPGGVVVHELAEPSCVAGAGATRLR